MTKLFLVNFSRFDVGQPNFFDAGTRNYIINFILERQHFIEGEETPDNLGIEKLLADGVYESAYTLHDVSREWEKLPGLSESKKNF